MKFNKIATTFLSLGLALGAGSAMAQSTAGTLLGEGKPGDVVVVTNPEFGFSREVTVKDNGKYRLPGLSPGLYSIVVRHTDGSMDAEVRMRVIGGAASRVGSASP